MSKRQVQQQSQQQNTLSDLQVSDLIDHDENTDLFENLSEDFQEMMSDKLVLRNCIDKFIENLIDQFTLGIIFDLHRKYKINAYCLEVEDSDDDDDDSSESDVFQQVNIKKNQDCVCPNCDRAVGASRFAPHLETCMGMGRVSRSSRNASRRVANNKDKNDTSSYGGIPSDDDDDVDWNSSERKRNRKKDKNGGKKNRGTPKKNLEPEPVEPLNVDIEGDDEELTILRDMLHLQDRRPNSASPAEGSGTSNTPKKRDKSKKKNKTKDRSSPSTSMSLD